MEKYKPTVTLFFDQRVQKKSARFPLKLTIYCKPYKKRYNTDIDLSADEWKKVNSEKLRDENLKETRFKINALKNRAIKIIEGLTPFSFKKFEEAFYENAIDFKSLTLSNLFDRYIAIHNKKGSVGTAISYRTTKNSLLEYKKSLSLFDMVGHKIKILLEDLDQSSGRYKIPTDISDLPGGIYFYQLNVNGHLYIQKLVVAK